MPLPGTIDISLASASASSFPQQLQSYFLLAAGRIYPRDGASGTREGERKEKKQLFAHTTALAKKRERGGRAGVRVMSATVAGGMGCLTPG